jgi:hypothetical protein
MYSATKTPPFDGERLRARSPRDGDLEAVRGLASKLPEHAARIAAALTFVQGSEMLSASSTSMPR